MRNHFQQLLRDRSGSTAIEYALLASLIALLLIGSLISIGTTLSGWFGTVASSL